MAASAMGSTANVDIQALLTKKCGWRDFMIQPILASCSVAAAFTQANRTPSLDRGKRSLETAAGQLNVGILQGCFAQARLDNLGTRNRQALGDGIR